MFKRILFHILAVLIPICMFLGAAEIVLRIIPSLTPEMVTREHQNDVMRLYQPNSESIWFGSLGQKIEFRNPVRTNRLAFHDLNYPFEKPSGNKRIVIIGDSYVEALQVPLNDTFHKVLQSSLSRSGEKYEVIALGNSGDGMLRNFIKLKNLAVKFEPDVVVAMMTPGNDFSDDWHHFKRMTEGDGQLKAYNPDVKTNPIMKKISLYNRIYVFKWSRLNRLIAFYIAEFLWKKDNHDFMRNKTVDQMKYYALPGTGLYNRNKEEITEAYKITTNTILKMREFCESQGIRFLLCLIDRRMNLDPATAVRFNQLMGEEASQINVEKQIGNYVSFLRSRGVEVLDLHAHFLELFRETGKSGHWARDGHWNKHGHQAAAEAIKSVI